MASVATKGMLRSVSKVTTCDMAEDFGLVDLDSVQVGCFTVLYTFSPYVHSNVT